MSCRIWRVCGGMGNLQPWPEGMMVEKDRRWVQMSTVVMADGSVAWRIKDQGLYQAAQNFMISLSTGLLTYS